MDKTVKILIIVVIILLAGLSVVAGIMLQSYLFTNKNNNSNQYNTSVNVSVNNQTTQTNVQDNLISAQKAINIAKQNAGPSKNVRFSAKLIQNGP